MKLSFFKNTFLLCVFICFSCGSQTKEKIHSEADETLQPFDSAQDRQAQDDTSEALKDNEIIVGAALVSEYLPLLKDKNVGVVANQTSTVGETHLVDILIEKNISVKKVFTPEHGFRGKADAGELVKDGIDPKTGLPIISLYGKNKKLSKQHLEGLDILIFDIQDVGARFYTYISSLHYVMEACAEVGISLLIMDRPNPNGHYIDGPILEKEHSFVGMHPIPVVHGMTIGEYAQMINGEKWLANKAKCDIRVIKMKGYTHQTEYTLPIKPSPNLPNDVAVNLYPSLCFFEGTFLSAGRGTEMQFQIFGAPSLASEEYSFQFTPQANEGAKYPKFKGELCYGKDLRSTPRLDKLNLEWLIDAYVANGKKKDFFNDFFTKLAGTKKLQQQIQQGFSFKEIKATWQDDLKIYDEMRQQYLLYK